MPRSTVYGARASCKDGRKGRYERHNNLSKGTELQMKAKEGSKDA